MKLKDATVLVVDDEPMLCDIFSEWLNMEGCRTFTAENGVAALKVLEAQRVDIVVTDIRMPVMDGVAFVRALHSREKEARHYIPKLVFITGFADVEPRDAYDLGVEALMQKPIGRESFISTIAWALLSPEEKWSQTITDPAAPLHLVLPPVPTAIEQGAIEFGRGGFCIHCEHLPPGPGPIRFELKFGSEALVLTGRGQIRWLDFREHQAGIEILNVDDACRDWATQHTAALSSLSYIPRACRRAMGAGKAGGA